MWPIAVIRCIFTKCIANYIMKVQINYQFSVTRFSISRAYTIICFSRFVCFCSSILFNLHNDGIFFIYWFGFCIDGLLNSYIENKLSIDYVSFIFHRAVNINLLRQMHCVQWVVFATSPLSFCFYIVFDSGFDMIFISQNIKHTRLSKYSKFFSFIKMLPIISKQSNNNSVQLQIEAHKINGIVRV